PAEFGDGARCSFTVGMCLVGGTVAELHQDYCCFEGLWDRCLTENPECDPADAGVDAALPVDAPERDGAVPTPDAGAPDDADAAPAGDDASAGDDAIPGDDAVLSPDAPEPDAAVAADDASD